METKYYLNGKEVSEKTIEHELSVGALNSSIHAYRHKVVRKKEKTSHHYDTVSHQDMYFQAPHTGKQL